MLNLNSQDDAEKTTGRLEKHSDQVDASLNFGEDGIMWGKAGQCS